jgi:hypothetical protein
VESMATRGQVLSPRCCATSRVRFQLLSLMAGFADLHGGENLRERPRGELDVDDGADDLRDFVRSRGVEQRWMP